MNNSTSDKTAKIKTLKEQLDVFESKIGMEKRNVLLLSLIAGGAGIVNLKTRAKYSGSTKKYIASLFANVASNIVGSLAFVYDVNSIANLMDAKEDKKRVLKELEISEGKSIKR